MSQKVLNSDEVHTSLYEPRRERIAEIVEAKIRDAGEFRCLLEALLKIQQTLAGFAVAGDEFAFYKELKDIVVSASKDIFSVDNYLNTEFFVLYVEPIRPGTPTRILTDKVAGSLQIVATKYATRRGFELRSSTDVHDRHIFVVGRGWPGPKCTRC
jgi:hypothetical protein